MFWRRLTTIVKLLLIIIAGGLLIFVREWPAFGSEADQLTAIVGQQQFDFLIWEARAFQAKAEAMLANGHTFLSEEARKQIVLDTLALMRQARTLDAEITRLYIDPDVVDPDAASADLQVELIQVRQQLEEIQPAAEAIIQDQVAAILVEEGFDLGGQAWPPVMMHMTPLPTLLVTSPRDRIERTYQRPLVPGLTTPDKEVMETAVTGNLDLSALIVPIGGMGTYPSMIQESSNINWLSEVTAHEWGHHWLNFQPVGFNYNDPEVRTINETIASIIDVEIGDSVIERFYPEFVPPPPPENEPEAPEPAEPIETPLFDFQAEMAETRIRVDALLAEGQIEEAEAYMETRRRLFVENGYPIRKLNQAYFAFYGAYAARPGATGSDPTGPMLRDIREQSPTLRGFMETVAPISSFADLERIWQETAGNQ